MLGSRKMTMMQNADFQQIKGRQFLWQLFTRMYQ
jgi:hypothetical protein